MLSNVEFKSNLYPVKEYFRSDGEFLLQIHDIFALEILKRTLPNFKMSPLQVKEYRAASVHCSFARKGDYPFGTIFDKAGNKTVACKCLNTSCRLFKKCRPDFNPAEMNVLAENKAIHKIIQKILSPVEIPKPKLQPVISPPVKIQPPPPVKIPPSPVTPPPLSVQAKVIQCNSMNRIIVNGGPGTGKTFALIEKIRSMVNSGVPQDKILVFCFSRAAIQNIRSRMPAEFSSVDLRTFDSFATLMLSAQGYSLNGKSYDARILAATDVLNSTPDILDAYSQGHVIVDEVQDLVGSRAEMVLALLKVLPDDCGFTLLGDPCQSIFDYLSANNPTVMSSQKFYASIYAQFPKIQTYKLAENYRQTSALENLIAPYRENILKGDGHAFQARENIKAQIPKLGVKIDKLTLAQINDYLEFGTLGILTRSNGQALQVSSWLNTNDIPHKFRSRSRYENLSCWIAKFFCDYPNDTISEKDFTGGSDKWAALVDALGDKRRYEVEEILRELTRNPKNNILFELDDDFSAITVSDIHLVKGNEFDSVILLNDIFDLEDTLSEHKICYVGLTRARKKIAQIEMDKQYIRILQNENRRCFKTKISYRTSKQNLSSFEIALGDVDFSSFGENSSVQDFISQKLKVGDYLTLKKLPRKKNSFVQYEIIIEEPECKILGRTSKSFAADLDMALRNVKNLPSNVNVYDSLYPIRFEGVYVNAIISCVTETEDVPAARNFGGMKIWLGLTISGFAHVADDKF